MPEPASQITIISDLLKRDPAYREVIDHLEEQLYNRYMVYLADKPRFNARTQAIPKPYLHQIISFKNTLEFNKIAKKYNFTQEQRDNIPSILWKIFYREAELKNLPQMLNSELNMNNIHFAYLASIDIANIYMPISDFLGDVGMVIKRWQYEMPAETAIGYQPTTISQQQSPTSNLPDLSELQRGEQSPISTVIPPPIKPPIDLQTANYPLRQSFSEASKLQTDIKDESIPKVQEAMNRIAQIGKIQNLPVITPPQIPSSQELPPKSTQQILPPQTAGHTSDLEPEYLPDEPQPQPTPEVTPVNKANVIDLKNF